MLRSMPMPRQMFMGMSMRILSMRPPLPRPCRQGNKLKQAHIEVLLDRGHQTSNIRVRMFENVRYFFFKSKCSMFECSLVSNVQKFECSMFVNIQVFESSNVRMFAYVQMFESSNFLMFANVRISKSSMIECSLILKCSKVRFSICSLMFELSNVRKFNVHYF